MVQVTQPLRWLARRPRAVVAGLAANAVAWRSLSEPFAVRAIASSIEFADGVLGTVTAAFVATVVTNSWVLGFVFEWALVLYGAGVLIRRLAPGGTPADLAERTAVKVLVAAGVLAFALVASGGGAVGLSVIVGSYGTPLGSALASFRVDVFLALIACLWAGFVVYVWWPYGFGTASPDQVADHLAFRRDFAEAREGVLTTLERGGLAARLERTALAVVIAGILTVCCLVLGVLVGIVSWLFPVSEFLLLVSLALGRVLARVPVLSAGRFREGALDVEATLFSVVTLAIASTKGMLTAMVVACSLLFVMVLVALSAAMSLISLLVVAALLDGSSGGSVGPLLAWNALGYLILTGLGGWYLLWFWLRMVRRLPHYVEWWHARRDLGRSASRDPPRFRTRPVALALPAVGFWVLTGYVASLPSGALGENRVLAAVWLPLFALAALEVRYTFRTDPQPACTDHWALPAAVTAQIAGAFLVTALVDAPIVDTVLEGATILLGFLGVFYLEELREVAEAVHPAGKTVLFVVLAALFVVVGQLNRLGLVFASLVYWHVLTGAGVLVLVLATVDYLTGRAEGSSAR